MNTISSRAYYDRNIVLRDLEGHCLTSLTLTWLHPLTSRSWSLAKLPFSATTDKVHVIAKSKSLPRRNPSPWLWDIVLQSQSTPTYQKNIAVTLLKMAWNHPKTLQTHSGPGPIIPKGSNTSCKLFQRIETQITIMKPIIKDQTKFLNFQTSNFAECVWITLRYSGSRPNFAHKFYLITETYLQSWKNNWGLITSNSTIDQT